MPNPFVPTPHAWLLAFPSAAPITLQRLPSVFAAPFRPDIIHRCVVSLQTTLRAGTASTKGISDIRGRSGKAFPQKGRGKARVGTVRAPQFRGGGVVFGPKPRIWRNGVPRKVWRMGMKSALTAKLNQGNMAFVEALQLPDTYLGRTKEGVAVLDKLGLTRTMLEHTRRIALGEHGPKILLVTVDAFETDPARRKLWLACRNLPNVELRSVSQLDIVSIVQSDHIVMDMPAMHILTSMLHAE